MYTGGNNMEDKKAFNPTEYKNKFQKDKYDRIIVNVIKGEKSNIEKYAKENGYKSLNSFVVEAIKEKMDQ